MKNSIIALFSCFMLTVIPLLSQSLTKTEVEATIKQAFAFEKEKKYQEALDLYLIVGEGTNQKRTEEERNIWLFSQTKAGFCYEMTGKYKEGYSLTKSLIGTNLLDSEKKDVYYYYALNGYLYASELLSQDKADYPKVQKILEEILPYSENDRVTVPIKNHLAVSYYYEGALYKKKQDHEQALPLFKRAAVVFHEIGDYKNEIKAWFEIAQSHEALYQMNDAENAYLKGLELAKNSEDDKSNLTALQSLSRFYSSVGNTTALLKVENDIYKLVSAKSTPKGLFDYYNYRGDEELSLGNLANAELWYLKGKDILSSLSDQEANNSALNLLMLYLANKQYEKALLYAQKNADICHAFDKPDEPDFYLPYLFFVDIYKQKGDSANAQRYIDSLVVMQNYTKEPRELGLLSSARGRFYNRFGNYAKALSDYKEADRILATKYDENDPGRIELLNLMGGVENRLNHYIESERLYQDYAERIKKLLGENSVEYYNAISYLANAEGFAGHIEEGCMHYEWVVDRMKEQTKEQLPYLNTDRRENFWQPISNLLTNMTPFAIEANRLQDGFTRSCYDALLLSKSFLLEAECTLYDLLKSGRNDDVLETYESIAAMKSRIRELGKDSEYNADSILILTDMVKMNEQQILNISKKYGDITSFMNIDYNSVKANLNDDEILIDFTDYVSKSQGRKYAAFVISKSQEAPLLIPLFAESRIDSMNVTRPDLYYDTNGPIAEEMLDLLWTPFKGHIKQGSTVYYVPSHLLFQIAIESLPMEDGTLLGEHYHFVRLSSAHEMGKIHDNIQFANNKSAVLYGGLHYDMTEDEMAIEAQKHDLPPMFAMRGGIVRGDSIYRNLPGTLKEIKEIGKCLKAQNIEVIPYIGNEGTEESFLSLNGKSPALIHLATHGFYYTPEQADRVDYLKGYKDAMSLSGLVMSGGNVAWLGKKLPNGVLGGILTANNIARMDLQGAELVVLSACQTGQGNATSEGLYGLQRAFKKAGVQSMIMTLWNIRDEASCLFMEVFYKNLTNPDYNWNKRKAFEDAKNYLRTETKFAEPYYWAAFVLLD